MSTAILKETNSQLRTILSRNNNVLEQLKAQRNETSEGLLSKLIKANLVSLDGSPLDKKIADSIDSGNKSIIICNCSVSDRNNSISRYLLENHLDKIAAGICILAKVLNADEGILYCSGNALNEKSLELIKGYESDCLIRVATGEGSLVTKNETALIQAIDGKAIRPYYYDSEVTEYCGKSVVAIDAETACNIFEACEENQCGKLIAINGMKDYTAIAEVKTGTSLSALTDELGINAAQTKGVLLGGILGKFINASELDKYSVEYCSLYSDIQIFKDTNCMIDETLKVITEAYEQSCGKCVLCREGTTQFKTILSDVTKGRGKVDDLDLIKEVSEIIKIGAFCEFGRTMVDPITSSIALFDEEYKDHIKKKRCPASVCASFLNYYIAPDECTGCEECLDACPDDAIKGKDGYIHMIDEDMCTKCDKCRKACPEGAIKIMGAIKPKLPKKLTKVGKY